MARDFKNIKAWQYADDLIKIGGVIRLRQGFGGQETPPYKTGFPLARE